MTAPVQLFDTLDSSAARDLTDQIKVGVEAVWHLIARAYQGRAWAALGYSSWDDYCTREFGTARLRLPREDRQEVVASLRESGLSTRAIAAATGHSEGTVRNDLAAGAQDYAPAPVTGLDGKQYKPTQPEPHGEPEPLFAPGERDAILDTLHEEYGDDLTAEQIEQAVEDNIESKRLPDGELTSSQTAVEHETKAEWQPTKPDLGDGISHPARYSPELVEEIRKLLAEHEPSADNILDPFAGPGGIHALQVDGWETVGIELEPEWANLHPDTRVGNALDLPFDPETFGTIVTSPTYGNRLADSHNASDPERRRSYTHDLGHPLEPDNSGTMHWRNGAAGSAEYRTFHEKAWDEAVLVLKPGGLFILNMCDHVRGGLVQPVTAWHCWMLGRLGLDYLDSRTVPTRKLRQGANDNLREQEYVHVFRKPL